MGLSERRVIVPMESIAVCRDCDIYWECEDDNIVPICPQDTTEDRSHRVALYRLDS